MSITTKTGDDGYTDIIRGKRLPKNHPILECLGTIDELNAFLGDAKAALGDNPAAEIIEKIQKNLFTLMGVIAGMPVPAGGMGEEYLVNLIEKLESELPPFASFVVPGANPASAKLHVARTVCRRVERRMIGLGFDTETEAAIVPYINRLSDLLFLLAQKEAFSKL
ncbi:MAG: cob(I)yrinic acid a,c-diamide adenosyltransferase [Treponema sp.]|jgi:cob(I)alamin adenosyltransferase|nr:cob(I)yrinic acid a,c-diamide adenosyltransferase [Treponema sp.]